VFAGAILVALAWLAAHRKWRWRRSLPIFAALWVAVSTYAIVEDIRNTSAIRKAVRAGKFRTIEGCLDYFRPGAPHGTKSTSGNEEWSVGGVVFSYGAGEVRPAFHAVSTAGGPVQADSRVRVSFVENPGWTRNEIVKLELDTHACPPARHVEAFAQP
jgi:hypothetical protein